MTISSSPDESGGATDLVNSLLNYGYGILYPRVHHALMLAGLNPVY
jgi:CRISPR-associated protein Cas1